jgi:hypothetical protein
MMRGDDGWRPSLYVHQVPTGIGMADAAALLRHSTASRRICPAPGTRGTLRTVESGAQRAGLSFWMACELPLGTGGESGKAGS